MDTFTFFYIYQFVFVTKKPDVFSFLRDDGVFSTPPPHTRETLDVNSPRLALTNPNTMRIRVVTGRRLLPIYYESLNHVLKTLDWNGFFAELSPT